MNKFEKLVADALGQNGKGIVIHKPHNPPVDFEYYNCQTHRWEPLARLLEPTDNDGNYLYIGERRAAAMDASCIGFLVILAGAVVVGLALRQVVKRWVKK